MCQAQRCYTIYMPLADESGAVVPSLEPAVSVTVGYADLVDPGLSPSGPNPAPSGYATGNGGR